MGGEDRPDREPGDEGVELRVGPPEPAQARDGVRHRIVEDPVARGTLAPAQRPDTTARLGEVDEPEIEGEGGDDGLGRFEVEPAELLVEPGTFLRVVVAPERDRPFPDALDRGEQLRSRLLGDHLAEEGTEQPDLGRERVARPGRPDAERLGGDRGRLARRG